MTIMYINVTCQKSVSHHVICYAKENLTWKHIYYVTLLYNKAATQCICVVDTIISLSNISSHDDCSCLVFVSACLQQLQLFRGMHYYCFRGKYNSMALFAVTHLRLYLSIYSILSFPWLPMVFLSLFLVHSYLDIGTHEGCKIDQNIITIADGQVQYTNHRGCSVLIKGKMCHNIPLWIGIAENCGTTGMPQSTNHSPDLDTHTHTNIHKKKKKITY